MTTKLFVLLVKDIHQQLFSAIISPIISFIIAAFDADRCHTSLDDETVSWADMAGLAAHN